MSSQKHSDIFRSFLGENADLIGASGSQIEKLKTAADYTNPDGNLSFVELEISTHDCSTSFLAFRAVSRLTR